MAMNQLPSLILFAIAVSVCSGAIQYPATIQTKGASHSGKAQVDLKNFDNYDQTFFNYEATFDMGSSTRITLTGSTADGDKVIVNEKRPDEAFTRVVTQKVSKSRDGNGIYLSVFIQTTLKLPDGVKEKYGKTTIGVRIAPGRKAAHYWDIKHEYSNNYEGEDEGEVCLGCEEEEEQIDAAVATPPKSITDLWEGRPFKCNWEVNDAESKNYYKADVVSDGNLVRGEYRVLLPDGRTQIVTYTADWVNGYQAVVKYEGGPQAPAYTGFGDTRFPQGPGFADTRLAPATRFQNQPNFL